jgi:hypothetical protein
VIDILLVAEFTWTVFLLSIVSNRRAMICTAGTITSGYLGFAVGAWFTNVFAPPGSPAMLWIENHMTQDVEHVMSILSFVPPEPVSVQPVFHIQWVAYHVLRVISFVVLTITVFIVFVVVSYAIDAILDYEEVRKGGKPRFWPALCGISCGVYLVVLTTLFIGNLAWLKPLSFLPHEVENSLITRWIAVVVQTIESANFSAH